MKTVPEGNRELHDVSVVFDCEGENGLLGPGERSRRTDVLVYPSRFPVPEIELSGFLQLGQETVCVRARLNDSTGYSSDERWCFPLPAPPTYKLGVFTVPQSLPLVYERFFEALRSSKERAMLAVFDEDLGRDTFIEDWALRFPGSHLDLDHALADMGIGRAYGARPLDAASILETIDNAITQTNFQRTPALSPPGVFLIGPADDVIARLVAGEARCVLETWWAALLERARRKGSPPLALLVSSGHARRLRSLSAIPEIAVHSLPLHERKAFDGAQWSQLRDLVCENTGLDRSTGTGDAERYIRQLGIDLRLVLRWLRWVKEGPGRDYRSLESFLKEGPTEILLRSELGSLEPFDLINAILGAEAETALKRDEVRPGHVAAQDHLSTTRKYAQKLIQRRGLAFSDESLGQLDSYLQPLDRLRVQGFGIAGTAESQRCKLLGVALCRDRKPREESFRRLAARGFGSWIDGIFRTTSPYRELINRLYDRHAAEPEQERDSRVYAAVAGVGRTPVEAFPTTELGTMPPAVVKQLLPNTSSDDSKKLQRLARLWRQDPREAPALVLAELFRPDTVKHVPAEAERCDFPLASLGLPCFGVGPPTGHDPDDCPELYLFWVAHDEKTSVGAISEAAETAAQRREQRRREALARGETTVAPARVGSMRVPVAVIGSGAEGLVPDPRRNVAMLRFADAAQAAYEGDLVRGLRRKVRAQIPLTAFSPFRTHGALPPGSPLFRGRERELDFIKGRLREASILVVGSRQVGKTSLLNQVLHWTRQQADLEPFYLDLQGVTTSPEFLAALKVESDNKSHSEPVSKALRKLGQDPRTGLIRLARRLQDEGKLPVFLLNEVDGLVEGDSALIDVCRGLNDQALARFITVGYSVIGRLGDPHSPFFNFTQGTSYGGRAIALTALSQEAAESLLELLTLGELGLIWQSEEERKAAYALVLERSYRIPWVLQYLGQELVQRMEEQRRDVLNFNDVERVVAREGNVVWQYMAGIDYKSLGYRGFDQAQRPGFQLVLFAIARARYFLGGPRAPIRDPRLRDKESLAPELGFTVGEAQEAVENTMDQLLVGEERIALKEWLGKLDLGEALRRLTLTLALEPDPDRNDRYGFLLHILPLELNRRIGREGPTLDNLIINEAIEFLRLIRHSD